MYAFFTIVTCLMMFAGLLGFLTGGRTSADINDENWYKQFACAVTNRVFGLTIFALGWASFLFLSR